MGYKIRQKPTWYRHALRTTRRAWQPLVLVAIFVLGITVGTFVAMQEGSVIAGLTGKEQAANVGPLITKGADSAQALPPLTSAGKVQGATVSKADIASAQAAGVRSTSCGAAAPARAGLSSSSLSLLRKLAEHETVCGNAVANRVSFFAGTPTSVAQAKEEARWVADVLKEISKQGLGAVVFLEPSSNGQTLNTRQYRAGTYDAALDAYFAALKTYGITDTQMGVWVPFPEANIPVWDSTDPDDFAANVTRTVQIQKKHFPKSRASVLLDSKSYPLATSWEGGAYKSFVPYVRGIPKGLINSFGLQGFAWPPQDGEPAQLDAKTFLPGDLAVEAANAMGVKDIWFNTGSFGRAARQDKAKPDILTHVQRQAVMDGIIAQAKAVKAKGFNTSIHLFAENKFSTPEAIDWSFWANPAQSDAESHKAVYRTFIRDARSVNIPFWIFDSL